MTTKVTIANGRLVVEPLGWDKVWSLRRRIAVPLEHVRGATYDPEAKHASKGLKVGMRLPGYKWAGMFIGSGERTFWNADARQGVIEIELSEEFFDRLYIGLDLPEARSLVDEINGAIAG